MTAKPDQSSPQIKLKYISTIKHTQCKNSWNEKTLLVGICDDVCAAVGISNKHVTVLKVCDVIAAIERTVSLAGSTCNKEAHELQMFQTLKNKT